MTAVLKRTFASIIFICLILIAAYPALAQDATSPATTRREAVKERVATLKQKLATFRDKTKAQTAERINATLANINEKITANMKRHLEKMTLLLGKLEERVNSNTPGSTSDIKDPAAAREAISLAKNKIAAANAAVDAQMEKDYVIVASSEATIRADAQAAKEQLHTDLKAVRQLVIEAKQAVGNAIRVAKSNSGGNKTDGQ